MTKKNTQAVEEMVDVTEEVVEVKAPKAKKTTKKATPQLSTPIGEKVNAEKVLMDLGRFPVPGEFESKKALQKFYKQLDTEVIEAWGESLGVTFKADDNASIHRMRAAMSILYSFYPKEPAKKKESKYAKYSLEDLVTLAMDNDVVVEPTEDARIMRMRSIMALRDAGIIEA